jgi:hypothetical protein
MDGSLRHAEVGDDLAVTEIPNRVAVQITAQYRPGLRRALPRMRSRPGAL